MNPGRRRHERRSGWFAETDPAAADEKARRALRDVNRAQLRRWAAGPGDLSASEQAQLWRRAPDAVLDAGWTGERIQQTARRLLRQRRRQRRRRSAEQEVVHESEWIDRTISIAGRELRLVWVLAAAAAAGVVVGVGVGV